MANLLTLTDSIMVDPEAVTAIATEATGDADMFEVNVYLGMTVFTTHRVGNIAGAKVVRDQIANRINAAR